MCCERVVLNQHSLTSSLSSSELLKQLHWLPIEWRIRFKLATLTFKAFHTGLSYLHTCISFQPFATPRTHEVSALI